MKLEQISLLATLVLAFAALAALVLSGQAGIREDVRALRIDMQAGQESLRTEMQAGQESLRAEMQAGQESLRAEMRAGQAELRAGQLQLREDLTAFGARLAVVEYRTGKLESRFAGTAPRSAEPCEALDCSES